MKTQSQDEVLRVTGLDRLTAANATYFKETIQAVIAAQHRIVEVDCSRVSHMDSDGLGALVAIYKLVSLRNGTIRLTGVQPMVRQLLELLKFQQLFEITH